MDQDTINHVRDKISQIQTKTEEALELALATTIRLKEAEEVITLLLHKVPHHLRSAKIERYIQKYGLPESGRSSIH